jgi:hypothetical protein
MPLYRFCRPEDIPMIVQALNACYDCISPHPAMTVAQFREEMGLISCGPATHGGLETRTHRRHCRHEAPYGCWIAKLGCAQIINDKVSGVTSSKR